MRLRREREPRTPDGVGVDGGVMPSVFPTPAARHKVRSYRQEGCLGVIVSGGHGCVYSFTDLFASQTPVY